MSPGPASQPAAYLTGHATHVARFALGSGSINGPDDGAFFAVIGRLRPPQSFDFLLIAARTDRTAGPGFAPGR